MEEEDFSSFRCTDATADPRPLPVLGLIQGRTPVPAVSAVDLEAASAAADAAASAEAWATAEAVFPAAVVQAEDKSPCRQTHKKLNLRR